MWKFEYSNSSVAYPTVPYFVKHFVPNNPDWKCPRGDFVPAYR